MHRIREGRFRLMSIPALRHATPEDLIFLQRVFRQCREAEFAGLAWSDEQRNAFFLQQSEAQESHYDHVMPDLERYVVERSGKGIGRLYLADEGATLCLVDIALLPEARGQGFGRLLVRDVIFRAEAKGQEVSLHVEQDNFAREWYGRLGFEETGVHGIYVKMRRAPAPS
jgi:ribosomal protein S18 acetylase RimI-like enzyme